GSFRTGACSLRSTGRASRAPPPEGFHRSARSVRASSRPPDNLLREYRKFPLASAPLQAQSENARRAPGTENRSRGTAASPDRRKQTRIRAALPVFRATAPIPAPDSANLLATAPHGPVPDTSPK